MLPALLPGELSWDPEEQHSLALHQGTRHPAGLYLHRQGVCTGCSPHSPGMLPRASCGESWGRWAPTVHPANSMQPVHVNQCVSVWLRMGGGRWLCLCVSVRVCIV